MRGWIRAAALLMAAVLPAMMAGGTAVQTQAATSYADTSGYEKLKELYEDDFRIGVAVQAIDHWNDPTAEIGNEAKEQLIRESFNSMTFGNEFKPAYNFDPSSGTLFKVDPAAEELLIWARENQMPVRGHVMVWHSQVNPAIFAKEYKATSGGRITWNENDTLDEECLVDRETLIERLRTYIYGLTEYTYAQGFADVIYAWDVVNEATDEKEEDGLRRSYWYKIIGPEFLYYSFLFAREAQIRYSEAYAELYGLDPEKDDLSAIRAKLFYNDYNEWYTARCDTIIRFLTEDAYNAGHEMVHSDILPEDGDGTIFGDGLVDGIGMQGHLDDTQNIDQYMKALERYDSAVGLVHITELDVGETASGEQGEYKQAQFYYDFFGRLKEEKESGVNLASVTFWGLTDDASWRKGANPLLFRGDLETKPAFDAVVMAAEGEPFALEAVGKESSSLSEHIDFEPYKENGTTVTVPPDSVGFYSRGAGHQSALVLVNTENHTEDAVIGFALRVQRSEPDATVKKEINSYIGASIDISMFVKTQDKEIVLGVESQEALELARIPSDGEWTGLKASVQIPSDWPSASLYLETDGAADIFIDDITIDVTDAPEEMIAASEELIDLSAIPEREIPDTEALRFSRGLTIGWNLGNTMDAFTDPLMGDEMKTETAWQHVKTTSELIHAVHEAGFDTLRIPVSWHNHVDADYTISEAWLDRVQEIVDYAFAEGMYVIVNIHHDNELAANALFPDSAHLEQSEKYVKRIWEQVADRFAEYDEHLIFASMNEPRLVGHTYEWQPNTADPDIQDAFNCINVLNQDFVDTVRAADGENKTRYLLVPGYCGSPESVLSDLFVLPEDPEENDHRIMVSFHAYTPYEFALNKTGTAAFSAKNKGDTRDIASIFDRIFEKFVANGIPVINDEMGSVDKDGNLTARIDHAAFFTAYAKASGIPVIWWDNGAFSGDGEIFGIIDRESGELRCPEIVDAMIRYGK